MDGSKKLTLSELSALAAKVNLERTEFILGKLKLLEKSLIKLTCRMKKEEILAEVEWLHLTCTANERDKDNQEATVDENAAGGSLQLMDIESFDNLDLNNTELELDVSSSIDN